MAQLISYELVFTTALLPAVVLSSSLNVTDIVYMQERTVWFIFPLFPMAVIFFIACLAETNRAPFDLAEAEAELVAGYNVEYSSFLFALFYLGEYCFIVTLSLLYSNIFLG